MKKSRLTKILIMLGCVIMVALPILLINSKPIEAKAADSAPYAAMKSMTTLSAMNEYLSAADAATLDLLTEDEIQRLIVNAHTILYTEPEIDNGTEPVDETEGEGSTEGSGEGEITPEPEPYDPPAEDKLLYINIVNTMKPYYQQDDNYLKTDIHAPQSADDDLHYNVGENSEFIGVADEGFTVSRGTVTLHITSTFFTMHGPITVNGGTLNIVLETSDGTHIKREVESDLRVSYNGTSETYIPVDARLDCSVTVDENNKTEFVIEQFGGAFFTVRSGTLNITGNGSSQKVILSGAGQYASNIGLLRDDDTGNDNGGNVIQFPKLNSDTADDVEAKAPLIHVYDQKGLNPHLSLQYVKLRFNNNAGVNGTHNGALSGGAMYVTGASPFVTMSHVDVENCRTKHSGGFMYLSSTAGGSVSMSDVNISGCYTDAVNATEGGTLRTLGSSHCALSMTRVTYIDNYSKKSASAFLWSAMPAGELVVKDCNIKNNVAYGGSAIICMGRMSIEGTTSITGNRSITGSGAAISLTSWSSVTRYDAFRLMNDSNLTLDSGVTIKDNQAGYSGGAIVMDISLIRTNTNKENNKPTLEYRYKTDADGNVLEGDDKYYSVSLNVNGATITGNKAGTNGGAVYISKDAGCPEYIVKVNVNQGNISSNTAGRHGGAFYMTGKDVDFTITGGTVSENSAATDGGAIYLVPNAGGVGNVYVNGGTIKQNSAGNYGGGIYVQNGDITVNGETLITSNSAKRGGGAYITSNQQGSGNFIMEAGTIETNTATADGGAAYIDGESQFRIINGSINNNSCTYNGGAVFILQNGNFTMDNGELKQNTSGTAGGAIYIKGNGSLIMNDGYLEENNAGTTGGAVYMAGTGAFTMKKGYLKKNTAKNFAGAVALDGGGSFEMFDGYIIENKTLEDSGGAIRVQGGGSFTMHNGTIADNTADNSAGAIRMSNGNFTMYNGIIENNTCNDSGGFMYMQGGTCTIYNGIIRNNRKIASLNTGGAILIAKYTSDGVDYPGKFIMENGEIYGNTSVETAGAIALADNSTFEMRGGSIYSNTAAKAGGAVYISSGHFTMTGGSIHDNTAGTDGGAVYLKNGNFSMSGGSFYNNKATSGSGGAVYLNGNGSFTMSSGRLFDNTAPNGSGGAVYTGGTLTIGAEGCTGRGQLNHTICPIITGNSANNGGAFAVNGGNPTIHCGSITDNSATNEGGAMYVNNGNVLVNYVDMERNTAAYGAGFSIVADTKNLSVTICSGLIKYNHASADGGGIKVYAKGSKVATVVVGVENCDESHMHPDLSENIAEGEGGGLHLVSDSANGLLFTMWCGRLYDNIANGNIPTGNMIQEGGQVAIHGTYTIDNVTVNNGSFLRPSYGLSTVTINFNYRFPDGYTDDTNALKSITLTKGEENSESMYINLPAYKNIVIDGTTMILLRWSEAENNNNVTHETASKLVVNEANFNTDTVTFYGVWIARGAGIAEVPYVKDGQEFNTWQGGSSVAIDIGANGFFTALFEVSECDPSKFGERYLSFSRPFVEGTVITLVDLTEKSGYKTYYCYVISGEEMTVSLSSFTKMGSPLVHWSNSRADATGDSEEDLMFMFDLGLSAEAFTGSFWISLTRAYVDSNKAPISQTVSCAIQGARMPNVIAPSESDVGDRVRVNYDPGFAAEEDSVYYGKEAALVIRGKEETLPTEAYMLIGEMKYMVNTSGVIVIPIGNAKGAASLDIQLVSSALTSSETGIELAIDLYMCEDATRPMNDKLICTTEISMRAIPLPAISISMTERIFYSDSLPASVAIDVTEENIEENYRIEWTVLKQAFGATEYGSANGEAVVTDGVLTFGQNISEGNFRIIVKVIDVQTSAEVLAVPYNFIVLDS